MTVITSVEWVSEDETKAVVEGKNLLKVKALGRVGLSLLVNGKYKQSTILNIVERDGVVTIVSLPYVPVQQSTTATLPFPLVLQNNTVTLPLDVTDVPSTITLPYINIP